MLSITQDSTNILHIPNITTTEATLTLTVEGCEDKPFTVNVLEVCQGSVKVEVIHVCDDTDAFNLDLGDYKATVSDATGDLANISLHIYKNFL